MPKSVRLTFYEYSKTEEGKEFLRKSSKQYKEQIQKEGTDAIAALLANLTLQNHLMMALHEELLKKLEGR